MQIIIDNKIPFIKGVLEPFAEVVYLKGADICNTDLTDADALIIRTRTKVNKDLLKGTKVRFVATATIGTDHIDTAWCEKNGIKWAHAPGCNSGSVMQYLTASLVFLQNKYMLHPKDTTLGIVGIGNVGSKVAAMAHSLGFKTILNDPPREKTEEKTIFSNLDELIKQSDIISLHVPLTKDGPYSTLHMVNADFLSQMKKGSFLINTSRGPVINEDSLINSLKGKYLRGCILDVWEKEPHINTSLLKMTDIGTPHIAGYSLDGKAMGSTMIINQMAHFFDLPLKEWRPDSIPEPLDPIINIDAISENEQDIIRESVFKTYPIENDSKLLKESPHSFEELRGNYRNRREFSSYTVNGDNETTKTLIKLGFKQ